jgi:hypothetical protein
MLDIIEPFIKILNHIIMKQVAAALSLSVMILLCSFKTFDHSLVGRWVSHDGAPDAKILVDFNNDGTFKVTVNGETENAGNYKLNNDTFYMYDNHCGIQTAGQYKVTFYTEDSISFKLIQDSCAERIQEVNGGTIVRLKD